MPSLFQFEVTGTHTGANSTTVLIDASGNFINRRVQTGDTIYNTLDAQNATIISVDSAIQLTCSVLSGGAVWNAGDGYRIWVTEPNTYAITIIDELGFPLSLEAKIGNRSNVSETAYFDYQKVRVRETDSGSNLILFYGKIEDASPVWDEQFGQILKISSRDNLSELLKRTVRTDYDFGAGSRRSILIRSLIDNHVFQTGNIDTTTGDFAPSSQTLTLAANYSGAGKNVLRAIQELAVEDPWPTTGIGFDYLLDTDFLATTGAPSPDFWYFQRGTIPSNPPVNGLTVQFLGTEAAQTRVMLGDYAFSTKSRELVTRVKVIYQTTAGAVNELDLILINHGAVTNGPFAVNDVINWTGGANTAVVKYVDINDTYILITNNGDTTWLNTIGGQVITSGIKSATVNAATATPPGSLRETIEQEIEIVSREFEKETEIRASAWAAQILYHGGDSIVRGELSIIRWPIFDIAGTDTQVRAGHQIRVINSNVSLDGGVSTLNQNMLVTRIAFEQSPYTILARISVMGTSRGRTAERNQNQMVRETAETASWETSAAIGGIPGSSQIVNLDFSFSTTTGTTMSWPGGNATYADGSSQTINTTGSPYTLATGSPNPVHYIYVERGNPTLQIVTSFGSLTGLDNTLIAIAIANTDADIAVAQRRVHIISMNSGTPVIVAGTIIANQLSAITGNMGLLETGAMKIHSGTTNIVDTTNFTGFTINGSRIAGYSAGALQVELRSSDGHILAGAGAVEIDANGITIIGGGDGTAGILQFRDDSTTVRGTIWGDDNFGGLSGFFIKGFNTNALYLGGGGANLRVYPLNAVSDQLGDSTRPWVSIFGTILRVGTIDSVDGVADVEFSAIGKPTSAAGFDWGTSVNYWNVIYGATLSISQISPRTGSTISITGSLLPNAATLDLGATGTPWDELWQATYVKTRSDDGTGYYIYVQNAAGNAAQIGANLAGGAIPNDSTVLLLRIDKAGVESLEQVTLGATDSGGTGLRALVVTN